MLKTSEEIDLKEDLIKSKQNTKKQDIGRMVLKFKWNTKMLEQQ